MSEEVGYGLTQLFCGIEPSKGSAIVLNTWLKRIKPESEVDVYFPTRDYKKFSGLYGLFDGGEVVYIGRSTNIIARIRSHFINKSAAQLKHRRPFDGAAFLAANLPVKDLDAMETRLIQDIRPRGNRRPKFFS